MNEMNLVIFLYATDGQTGNHNPPGHFFPVRPVFYSILAWGLSQIQFGYSPLDQEFIVAATGTCLHLFRLVQSSVSDTVFTELKVTLE